MANEPNSQISPQVSGADNYHLPPQNIEAEEAILGGILLDPEAINRVTELLRPEFFAIHAHQIIYQAMWQLYSQGKATDLMTVTSWLADNNQLEKIGGQLKIAQLVERTVSAVNIDQYAVLVIDKYIRRKLIRAGNEIVDLGFQTSTKLETVLDQAEQKIFALTQDKPQQDLVPISETLINTFQDIEDRNEGLALPGIACNFYDLDAMTGGFQRSDLIIVAGRPSMGKCAAYDTLVFQKDGSLTTLAEIYKKQKTELLTLGKNWKFHITKPSDFIDDGIKPVLRVTTKLGRFVETTITHPFLAIDGWKPLAELTAGEKIAVPRRLDIFGNETIPENQFHLLINYDDCSLYPIVFQLEKLQLALFVRYLFSLDGWVKLFESGAVNIGYCTVSEKLVRQIQHILLRFGIVAAIEKVAAGRREERMGVGIPINCRDRKNGGVLNPKSQKPRISAGFMTEPSASPQKADESFWQLTITDALSLKNFIADIGNLDSENLGLESSILNLFMDNNLLVEQLENGDIYWDEIISITAVGVKQVYDLTIPETHNFVANDICLHNTSFAVNIGHSIAANQKLPVAIFSLEMSKEQLVLRLLASEARIESNRLRSGRISQNEWEPLTQAISTLSEMPIFIDDTPNITVNEMRSKARHLQTEQGGALGLILLDYLQLMESSSSDNRVQELARITRSLKGLARELSVPIIALSQLSRSVESRTNKRPMMSDLRESGCLTGETLISLADNSQQVPISSLLGKSHFAVWALNENTWKIESAMVSRVFSTGVKPIFCLKTALGRLIRATANHPFLTIQGWEKLAALSIGQNIAIPRPISCKSWQTINNSKLVLSGGFIRNERVKQVINSPQLEQVFQGDIYWDEIVAIEADGAAEVFDLTVPSLHNFVANNIIVHNSIEQDADLVIMLYRDEYYSPDTPDQGIAEVIITKHRNGPIGTVKLLFDPQFTKFRNLASPKY